MSETALSDLRVVELAQGVAGPYCGKLLADLGAEVVKAEPLEGDHSRRSGPFPGDRPDPERSGQFLYLNTNKRSITLDLDREEGRETLRQLVPSTDVLITDLPPSRRDALQLDYEQLAALNPKLILTCVTPFGSVGPWREYSGTAFTTYHVGGLGWGTPHNEVTDPPAQPPLAPGCYLADYVAGVTAASATLTAVAYRDTYGVGQMVDVSGMEAVANAIRSSLGMLSGTSDPLPPRRKSGFPWVWPCQDGHVSLSVLRDHWWVSLKELMGNPELAQNDLFDTFAGRLEHADVLELLIVEWLRQHPKQEIYQEALAHRLPGFPVLSIAELVASRQFQARDYFVEVAHPLVGTVKLPGAPVRFSRTPARIERAAPLLGEHNEAVRRELAEQPGRPGAGSIAAIVPAGSPSAPAGEVNSRPLRGIRIADFGWILSVPHATAWLGTLGAEVIRIESRASPDQLRSIGLTRGTDGVPGINRSAGYNSLNYSKKSITLNLADPRAVALAKELVRHSDVVTENFVVGTLERRGLGYEALRAIKPDLIMLSGSTVGQTGPERGATGWGPNSMALAGPPQLTGYAGGPPSSLDGTFPDFVIGVQMVFAILVALHERGRSGKGQYIDVAMAETVAAMVPEAVADYSMNGRERERMGNRHPAMAPQGVYPCTGDDAWVALTVGDDEQWRGLRRALGEPAWAADARLDGVQGRLTQHDLLDREIAAWTRQRDNYEVMRGLQAEGVAAVPVLNAEALNEDAQLNALGYMVAVDHKEVGVRRVPGIPGRYSAMPQLAYHPTPLLGEHNEEILCGLLGLPKDEFEQLLAAQVIY